MATRFYLPYTGTIPVTPASFAAIWTGTGAAIQRPMWRSRSGSTITSVQGGAAGTVPQNCMLGQFVSEPLVGVSVVGNWTAVMKTGENVAAQNASLQMAIRVASNDGATIRGTVYAGHSVANNATVGAIGEEFPPAGDATRIFPSTAGSAVTAQDGDRLVVEFGYRQDVTDNVAYYGNLYFGDSNGSDYALTSGLTTALNPWVETSQTLTFQTSSIPEVTMAPMTGG